MCVCMVLCWLAQCVSLHTCVFVLGICAFCWFIFDMWFFFPFYPKKSFHSVPHSLSPRKHFCRRKYLKPNQTKKKTHTKYIVREKANRNRTHCVYYVYANAMKIPAFPYPAWNYGDRSEYECGKCTPSYGLQVMMITMGMYVTSARKTDKNGNKQENIYFGYFTDIISIHGYTYIFECWTVQYRVNHMAKI